MRLYCDACNELYVQAVLDSRHLWSTHWSHMHNRIEFTIDCCDYDLCKDLELALLSVCTVRDRPANRCL